MGQIIKKIKFWRKKKTTRGIQNESVWVDIAKRTAKTFVQVTLGIIGTLLINPPDEWKPALTAAISTGACVAMNYFIKRIQAMLGEEENDVQSTIDETRSGQ